MISARYLLIAYAGLTAATAITVASPLLAIIVGIFTLGLSTLIPSIWLYITAMIPGLLLARIGLHWSIAALVSLTPAAALAILPARIAAPRAEQTLSELTAGDFRKPLPHRPERIELLSDKVAFVREGDDPIKHAACDEICQHLLLTRQVKTVTMIARALDGKPWVEVSYSLSAMARCPKAFDITNIRVLPSTTRARIAGLCIVSARGIGMTDGISIREQKLTSHVVPTFSLTTVELARQLDVSERRQGEDSPLLRSTEVKIGSASTPFMIFPYAGLLTSVHGMGIAKHDRTVNKQPLLAVMDQLGFSLVPDGKRRDDMSIGGMIYLADAPLRPDRTMMRSILAQPGADRFDSDLQDMVVQWTDRFWSGGVTADNEDRSVLSALTLDRRISRIGFNMPARAPPDMAALLAEPILTRLAWPVSDPSYDQDRPLAFLIRSQDKAFFSAHAAALLAIVRDHLSPNTSPLLAAAVGLGADATPAVLAGLNSQDMTIRIDAIEAACRAPADAATFLPVIRTTLRKQGRDNSYLIAALAALASTEAAEQEIEHQPDWDKKRLEGVLRNHKVDGNVICSDSTG